MPVLINQNFDVEGGIVNGSTGTIESIRYIIDENSERHLVSCTVQVKDCTDDALPHLEPHHIPILEDTVEMTFTHPFSKRKCTIHRTQVPILPAFAMTVHKAQGRTLTNVIVDLESCIGTESPYVMVSRATSLAELLILRPFHKHKIKCRQSQDSRNESKRVQVLALQTKSKHGSDNERELAKRLLSNYKENFPTANRPHVDNEHHRDSSTREGHELSTIQSLLTNNKRKLCETSPEKKMENPPTKSTRS